MQGQEQGGAPLHRREDRQSRRPPYDVQGQCVHIGASIGIVEDIAGYTRPVDIIRDAGLAMYRSKERGKARYTVYEKIPP